MGVTAISRKEPSRSSLVSDLSVRSGKLNLNREGDPELVSDPHIQISRGLPGAMVALATFQMESRSTSMGVLDNPLGVALGIQMLVWEEEPLMTNNGRSSKMVP